jgi:hypothetical protein
MVALKWPVNRYVMMFLKLLPMLDKDSNKSHVGGDYCWLFISFVVPYSFS